MTAAFEGVWAIVTARGGSKSIPFKNLALLAGRPLLTYALEAARASRSIGRIVCSTDSPDIARVCAENGVEALDRPARLAQDNVPSIDVVAEVLETLAAREGAMADVVVLLEPTSPFVLPAHVDRCVELLRAHPDADSAQTITAVAPNSHAFNQRRLRDGHVEFVFPEERTRYPNKQTKPAFYVHGNVRVVRSRCVLEQRNLFGRRSIPLEIPRRYALDVDGPEDLSIAEALIAAGLVGR